MLIFIIYGLIIYSLWSETIPLRAVSSTSEGKPPPANSPIHSPLQSNPSQIQNIALRLHIPRLIPTQKERLLIRDILQSLTDGSQRSLSSSQVQHQRNSGDKPEQKERSNLRIKSIKFNLENSSLLSQQQPQCPSTLIQPGPGTYSR